MIIHMRPMKSLREWVWPLRRKGVAGLVSSMMLVCAVAASLGVGVLAAQGICVGMFRMFKMHAVRVRARAPEARVRLGVVKG